MAEKWNFEGMEKWGFEGGWSGVRVVRRRFGIEWFFGKGKE